MKKKIFFVFMFTVLLVGCQNSIDNPLSSTTNSDNEFAVSQEQAIDIANSISLSANQTKSQEKTIKEIKSVNRGGNIPFLYIVNYKEGGFSVISGDKRLNPVLAFSDVSEFPIDDSQYPDGLSLWLNYIVDGIAQIRQENAKADDYILGMWKDKIKTKVIDPGDLLDVDCSSGGTYYDYERVDYGTLLQSKWGQRNGYNALLDDIGCDSLPPTGCVTVAAAQIMKFYSRPTNLNWSAMPNTYATNTTAQLMRDLGGYLNVIYDCNASGSIASNIPNVLRNYYGYSTGYNTTLNFDLIQSETRNGHPVVLGNNNINSSHAWICDGFEISYDYVCVYNPPTYTVEREIGTTRYHMNWGWYGNYDGYYEYPNFNVGSYNFNSIVNVEIIHP